MSDDQYEYAYCSRAVYGTYHYITAYNDFLCYICRKGMEKAATFTQYISQLKYELGDWLQSLTMKQLIDISNTFSRKNHMMLEPYTSEKPELNLAYLVLSDTIYRDQHLEEEFHGRLVPILELYRTLTIAQKKNWWPKS